MAHSIQVSHLGLLAGGRGIVILEGHRIIELQFGAGGDFAVAVDANLRIIVRGPPRCLSLGGGAPRSHNNRALTRLR